MWTDRWTDGRRAHQSNRRVGYMQNHFYLVNIKRDIKKAP